MTPCNDGASLETTIAVTTYTDITHSYLKGLFFLRTVYFRGLGATRKRSYTYQIRLLQSEVALHTQCSGTKVRHC